jgi:hypothetical protein
MMRFTTVLVPLVIMTPHRRSIRGIVHTWPNLSATNRFAAVAMEVAAG